MPLKKHHKWIIGSFSSIIIIFMIVSGVLIYTLFIQQTVNYNSLNTEVTGIKEKISEISENLIATRESLFSLDASVRTEISELKATTSADFSGIIEDAIKSVVTIRTDVSQGTGFIITEGGYIVTNAHVMAGAKAATIITYNEEQHIVKLIGQDSTMDIALLKIDGEYDELELADSDDVQIGEKVIAIGNPLGLQFSVTEGIVSAVDRPGANGIEAYIQTDAALNPGNSGGPLINKEGEAIGINNFKVGGGESLGFALESNYLRDSINEISEEFLSETLI